MGSSVSASFSGFPFATIPVGGGAITTASKDTTGANFVAVFCSGSMANSGFVLDPVSDNKGNTYTCVLGPASAGGGADGGSSVWVCFNPTVGTGHTWSLQVNSFATVIVDARSGVNSGTVTTWNHQGTNNGASTLNFSITPPDDGSLVYLTVETTTYTPTYIGGGFSGSWDAGNAPSSGNAYGGQLASLIQGTAAATAPTVNTSSVDAFGGYLLAFKPTSYSAGGVTLALTGNAATAAVGTLGRGSLFTKALTGNAATAACGTVLPSLTFGLTGNAGTGAVGTVSINGNVTLGLTGNQATSFVGTLAPGLSKAVTGNAGTSAVGTFSRASLVTLGITGNAGTPAVGTVSITGDRTVALTGVSALGAVGSVSITGGNVWTPVTPASGTWTPATQAVTTWTPQ